MCVLNVYKIKYCAIIKASNRDSMMLQYVKLAWSKCKQKEYMNIYKEIHTKTSRK